MNFSQNYLRKISNDYITDLKDNPDNFPHVKKIKRYGDYCRLEERIENARVVNADKAHNEGLEELKKMAKEDGIM